MEQLGSGGAQRLGKARLTVFEVPGVQIKNGNSKRV